VKVPVVAEGFAATEEVSYTPMQKVAAVHEMPLREPGTSGICTHAAPAQSSAVSPATVTQKGPLAQLTRDG
jgi:hypothetical protein